jgi:hypothetical protein
MQLNDFSRMFAPYLITHVINMKPFVLQPTPSVPKKKSAILVF